MLGIMRRQCGRRNLAAVVGSFPIYTAFLDSVKLTGAFLAADPSLDTKRVREQVGAIVQNQRFSRHADQLPERTNTGNTSTQVKELTRRYVTQDL